MKRLHIHVRAADLLASKQFYTALFGAAPIVSKPDYVKWMLDDPRINFAVSSMEGNAPGIDHFGIQVESDDELSEVNDSLRAAEQSTVAEPGAHCCYANGNKHWARDPQGVVWEMFHTMSAATTYGDTRVELDAAAMDAVPKSDACCG